MHTESLWAPQPPQVNLANIAFVVPRVIGVESWVSGLRDEDHALPSPQARQVHELLAAAARARRDQGSAFALVLKAIPG